MLRGRTQDAGQAALGRYVPATKVFGYAVHTRPRHNDRFALGVTDTQRAGKALKAIVGKRFAYRWPDVGAHL